MLSLEILENSHRVGGVDITWRGDELHWRATWLGSSEDDYGQRVHRVDGTLTPAEGDRGNALRVASRVLQAVLATQEQSDEVKAS